MIIKKLKMIESLAGSTINPYYMNSCNGTIQLHHYRLTIPVTGKVPISIDFVREGANIYSVWDLPSKSGIRTDEDGYAKSLKSFYHTYNDLRTLTVRLYNKKIHVENNMSAQMLLIFESHEDAELVYSEIRKENM